MQFVFLSLFVWIFLSSWNDLVLGVTILSSDPVQRDIQRDDLEAVQRIRREIRPHFDLYLNQVREAHGLDLLNSNGDSRDYLTTGVKSRRRRALIKAATALPRRRRRNTTDYEEVGSQVVRIVYPLNPQPFTYQRLSDLNSLQTERESYLFSLEETDSGTYTTIYGVGKDLQPYQLVHEQTPGASRIEVHLINSNIYVFPASYNRTSSQALEDGSVLFRFDPSARKLIKVQTIQTSLASAIHFWTGTGEEANDAYLSVAPQYQMTKQEKSYNVKVSVYRWQGAYYDLAYFLYAQNPQAIRHAQILSTGFLAIANYRDDTGSSSIHSEVFRYSHKDSKYVSFQKIRTKGAKSVEFCSVATGEHEDHFLAIANHCQLDKRGRCNYHVKSHIFKFFPDRFMPFQSFETYGAFEFLFVKADSKSFLLLAEISGIRIFQYNGWKFTQTYTFPYGPETSNSNHIRLRPCLLGTQPYITIASLEKEVQGGIYALEFQQKKDYTDMATDFEKECEKAVGRLKAENITFLVEKISEAPKVTDDEIIVPGSLVFKNGVATSNLLGRSITYLNMTLDGDTAMQWAKREGEIMALQQDIGILEIEAEGYIRRNENRKIRTEVQFRSFEYHGSPLKTTSVSVNWLNNVRLNEVFSKLIYLDQHYDFESVELKRLRTDHIEVDKLNGEFLSDFALKSGRPNQIFTGKSTFSSVSSKVGLVVSGLLDGVDFNNVDFLLKNGNQTFPGKMKIRDSSVVNLVAEKVNGVDLGYYMREGVIQNGPATITGDKHFDHLTVDTFQTSGLVNGMDIGAIFKEAIRTTGKTNQKFTGSMTSFKSLKTDSVSVKNGKLNNKLDILGFVSVLHGTYVFDLLEVLTDTKVHHVQVEKSLNNIQVHDGELDIILKDSPNAQKIGNKFIKQIHLGEDAKAHGLIDGIDLNNWSHEKKIELKKNRIRVGTFAPHGTLSLDQGFTMERYGRLYIEDSDVTRLLQKALLLNATKLSSGFRGTVNFDSLIVLGNSEVRTVNRVSPSDWLKNIDTKETVVVRGKKTFENGITLLSPSKTNGLYYKYSGNRFSFRDEVLSQLEDFLIDGKNQTIKGNTEFESVIFAKKLFCPPESLILNGIAFGNLVLIDSDQTVEGAVTFDSISVTDSFSVNGNMEAKLINGLDLIKLLNDTLRSQSSTPQIFSGRVKFDDALTMKNLEAEDLVGGYNVTELLKQVVRKDIPGQIIQGSVTFAESVEMDKLDYIGTLHGIPHVDWGVGVLLKNEERQVVHTPLKFDRLTVNNLTVTNGKVSNINVVEFSEDVIRIDDGGSLGPVNFTRNLVAEGGIKAKRVNGFDVHEDILLSNGKSLQTISGPKTFTHGWKIDGDLTVGSLQGIDYDQAAKFASGETATTDSLVIKGNLHLKDEPFFLNRFNGKDWNELLSHIWWKNEPTSIQATHSFESLSFENGATLNGLLAGVDITELWKSYFSLSKDQHLTGNVGFESSVTFENLECEEIRLDRGKINGIDLETFQDSVLLHEADQEIVFPIQFETLKVRHLELSENSMVNGMDLSEVAMTLHGDNVFKGDLMIGEVNAEELIIENNTLISGVNLKEWIANAVYVDRPDELSGNFQFAAASFTQNVEVDGLVDGMQFSPDTVLTLSGDQTLHGSVTLAGNVQVKYINLTQNLVNGINFKSAVEQLVLRNRGSGPLIVSGEKTFTQALKAQTLVTESLYQGYNLSETLENLNPQAYLSSHFNDSLEERYSDMEKLAMELHRVAERSGAFLDYFDLEARFVYKEEIITITAVKALYYHSAAVFCTSASNKKGWSNSIGCGSFSDLRLSFEVTFKGIVRDFAIIERLRQVFLIASVSPSLHDPSLSASVLAETNFTNSVEANIGKRFGRNGKIFVLKLSSSGNFLVHQIIHGTDFRTVATFQLHHYNRDVQFCAAALAVDRNSAGRAIVLCFPPFSEDLLTSHSDGNEGMKIVQTLPFTEPKHIIALTTKEKTFLLIGHGKEGSEVVDVWTHNNGHGQFSKETCIPVVSLQSMTITQGAGGQVLLAIATTGNSHYGTVYIYRYSFFKGKFEKIQSMRLRGVKAVAFESLSLVTAQDLLYVQADSALCVYTYKGIGGFFKEHEIPSFSAVFLDASTQLLEDVFQTHAIVASPTEIQIYAGKLNGLFRYEESSLKETLLTGKQHGVPSL